MSYNAGERKDVRKAEKAARVTEALHASFIRSMLSSVDGRAYAHSTLERSHVFRTTFSSDPLQMSFAEGQRNFGLELLNDIMRWCPEQYVQMMREANDRHNSNDRDPNINHAPTAGELNGSADSGRNDQGSIYNSDYDPFGDQAERYEN